jgi:uncharacterized alkaline shock family protein YloU
MEPQDTITIAPSVLIMTARYAALKVEGTARMGTIPAQAGHLLRGHPMGTGVVLDIDDNTVRVELYLVVKPGVSMREVSREVQRSVTRSIQDLIGMDVSAVNVHIEDVDYSPDAPPTT